MRGRLRMIRNMIFGMTGLTNHWTRSFGLLTGTVSHDRSEFLPNHDGEDSENWDAFYCPLGNARVALLTFVSLLAGKTPSGVEHWEKDLIP
jgi:guanylate kinase